MILDIGRADAIECAVVHPCTEQGTSVSNLLSERVLPVKPEVLTGRRYIYALSSTDTMSS